jgi:hypothetical protein
MSAKARWTAKEDAYLLSLYSQGVATGDAARVLGRSAAAVKDRAQALGVAEGDRRARHSAPRPYTADDDARIKKFLGLGLSVAACAARIGRSAESVRTRAKRLGAAYTAKKRQPGPHAVGHWETARPKAPAATPHTPGELALARHIRTDGPVCMLRLVEHAVLAGDEAGLKTHAWFAQAGGRLYLTSRGETDLLLIKG